MSRMRSSMSKKNKYYIDPERYLELKHFCMQFHTWRAERDAIGLSSLTSMDPFKLTGDASHFMDIVSKQAMATEELDKKIDLVINCCQEAKHAIWKYLLQGVTEGVSYEILKARGIPCGKDYYYEAYHKFFYILDKARK